MDVDSWLNQIGFDFLEDLEKELQGNVAQKSSRLIAVKEDNTSPEIDLEELDWILLTPTKARWGSYLLSKASEKTFKEENLSVVAQNSGQESIHRISTPHKTKSEEEKLIQTEQLKCRENIYNKTPEEQKTRDNIKSNGAHEIFSEPLMKYDKLSVADF